MHAEFHLISTTFDRDADLSRLLASLDRQSGGGDITLHLMDQGNSSVATRAIDEVKRFGISLTRAGKRLSLSEARNRLLENLPACNTNAIIAFPDDDCWYPDDLLERVYTFFQKSPGVDVLCTAVYDPDRGLPYGSRPLGLQRKLGMLDLFRLPISVGIFVRFNALEKAGAHFATDLGAGTHIGSGEETELVYRLLKSNAQAYYSGSFLVFHPVEPLDERDPVKAENYGRGFGYLSSKLIIDGNWSQVPFLMLIFAKSILGVVLYGFRPGRSKLYFHRAKGIISGLSLAWMNRKKSHERI